MVFRSGRGCGRAFSKDASRSKALCDPELPWIGYRGLSIEREHYLMVTGMRQILMITHDWIVVVFK